MPTVHALAVANTAAGTPRISSTVTYNGTSDKMVLVKLVCSTWASADPTMNLTIDVEQSFDNGTTWESFATLVTQGGRFGRNGNLPQMACQCTDDLGPRKARLVMSVDTGSVVAGVDVTT